MVKSDYLQEKKLNLADELRAILTSLEERQVTIKAMNQSQALALFFDLDRVFALFEQFEADGVNLLPEQGRFNAIQGRLDKNAAVLLKAIGGVEKLNQNRPSPVPAQEQWWWYSQDIVAERRQRRFRQIMVVVGIFALVIGLIVFAFRTFLAPSPEAIARFEAENQANLALEKLDYQAALEAIEVGLGQIPGDTGLLIYKGVLQQALGQEHAAQESFAEALNNTELDPIEFYLARSQLLLRLGQPELAVEDARLVLERDENVAKAWLLLGNALQMQGQNNDAILAFQRASEIAFEQGEDEIVVLARLALGRIEFSPQ